MKRRQFKGLLYLFILLNLNTLGNSIDSLYRVLNSKVSAEALNILAYEYYNLGKTDSVLLYANKAIEQSKKEKNNKQLAIALKNVGIGFMTKSHFDKALDYYKQSLDAFIEIHDHEQEARLYNNIATTYLIMGEFTTSLDYFKKALNKRTELGQEDSPLYGNLSIIYEQLGDHERSLEYALKSIKIAEEQNDLIGVAIGYGQLGEIYEHLEDFENADKYYLKSLEYLNDQGNGLRIARVFQNLGNISLLTNKISQAEEYFKKSLELKLEQGDKEGSVFSYMGLADVAHKSENYPRANKLYNQAIDIANEIESKHLIAEAKSKLGINLYSDKTNNLAKAILLESNKLALEIGKLEVLRTNFLYLSKIDSLFGNYKNSLKYYQLFANVKDSLLNEAKQRQIAEMQTRFDTEKKEKEIEVLKRDTIIKEKETRLHKQQKYAAIAGAILALLLLVLAGNRMKLRRKLFDQKEAKLLAEAKYKEEEALRKEEELRATAELNKVNAERAQEELDYRNREITSSALFVAQKNEILSTIGEKLEEIRSEVKGEHKKEITVLKRLIKDNIELDDDWDNFKLHFEKVHPSFFEKLTDKFPDLTSNEQKTCAYLRMNLSAKEIARLLNITPKSTQMSRYRLKKKFNLGADDDLMEFIKSI